MCSVNNLIIFAVVLCLFLGCSSSRNDVQEQEETSSSSTPPPVVSLSPESAKVEAYLLEYNQEEDHLICRIKIEKVIAYGSATPPLPSGTNIYVEISNKLLDANPEVRRKFSNNEHLFGMTIKMNKGGIGISANEKQIWKVKEIQ
jgi:hypothetical protein